MAHRHPQYAGPVRTDVLYSIVDRMYIGNIPEIGDMALAGVGICGPVVTMVGSIASLVGVGGAPLVGISMGEGNLRYAKKILSNCFLLIWVFSALIMATVLPLRGVFCRPSALPKPPTPMPNSTSSSICWALPLPSWPPA